MKIFAVLFLLLSSSSYVLAQENGVESKPESTKEKTEKAPAAANKPKSKVGEPSTATDFLLRGKSKQEADDLEGALADYDKAIEIDDKFPRAYLARGSIKFILQEFEAAIIDFNVAIDLAEKEIGASKKRGNVKTILEDHKGATKEFKKAASMKPILAEALFYRGNVKFFLDDKTGCCEDLQTSGDLGYLKAYNYIRKYCQD
ncbi:MAG: hypothetical protein JKY52_13150 [Flavobacteriales bacterium]|nr:hypothetical protein [Flavobacteriales bacterium]